ncbi:hypothetical protein GCM10027275_27630 [Rhabdobacter roseus]|uniref:Putative membrane protein n=1 Tax=Rhabdobacter roseus TaxID=1655419 RepID=A0A840TT19_9BACT|nr:hypothetical protein [Rhabdobacter roseus]MBB5284712.1 putative membrane protein [Rhabdobacter roseus]
MADLSRFVFTLRQQRWLAVLLCLLPLGLYAWTFSKIALNVNYVAYDDITILSVIPGFEEATWAERWQRLTDPFPEHRLVFSRTVVLLTYYLSGHVNLVGLMIVGNVCWAGCAYFFYRVFQRLGLSLWYFVPVMWLWFNIQAYENIFWGVSSLCNFGVLFFATLSLYSATHHRSILPALLAATAATFTYGNGILVFGVLLLLLWLTGRRRDLLITVLTVVLVGVLYFAGFPQKTPSLQFSDLQQVQEGLAGFFGFIGSVAALPAYAVDSFLFTLATAAGVILVGTFLFLFRPYLLPLFRALVGQEPLRLSRSGLFALALFLFVAITTAAVVYKRIPLGGFESLFKGRYRMYSTLILIASYLGALSWLAPATRRTWALAGLPFAVLLNLTLLYVNFAGAVNNRRLAVVQEFNTRYNADLMGLRMFNMSQEYFEQIRAYYQSDDPLAEGWNPRAASAQVPCQGTYFFDTLSHYRGNLVTQAMQDFFEAEQDYTDGPYVILKSDQHVYASPPNQFAVPPTTLLRRLRYFARGVQASFYEESIAPGHYQLYLLVRYQGRNQIYCTNRSWTQP